ncbi:uncharacterized protein L3040_005180 [Drepanopeziza brunnea f. sp. 'multigermtubi']|uniref:uncharacterized protein n=1 Tax=Drepanopeziza brunnea f. sp. 'multigermtubi' TaxID=698441 RepID=UPI002390924C|nr:hypothetical protein L3040_005180 [Drepanopeziza brunnea f. sp. 'multigermtubi']
MSQQGGYPQGPSSYVSNGGPVQHPLAPQYQSMPPAAPQAPVPIRASSGAWTPADDQTLMAARAQGLNWAPIQTTYFPSKTPNACRKRHERLMERRSADDWDGLKLENLAKHYMVMRREIWASLAAQTGEKWNVVEQKCMAQGLKNLQTAARSCARRERLVLSPNQPHSQHDFSSSSSSHLSQHHPHSHSQNNAYPITTTTTKPFDHQADDSGYADADADADDLDLDLEPGYASDRSSTGYQGGHYHSHSHPHPHSHSLSNGSNSNSNISGNGSMGGYVNININGGGGTGAGGDPRFLSQQQQQQHHGQGRLPSMDMGIGAIINRTGVNRTGGS